MSKNYFSRYYTDGQKAAVSRFYRELVNRLSDLGYVDQGSCNKGVISRMLVLSGTEDQISYQSKPKYSFRYSDHWNWYSSLKKCPNPDYIQCYNIHMPRPRCRKEVGKATEPWAAIQVAFYGEDGQYRCVYGKYFDRYTGTWKWRENTVDAVIKNWLPKEA